MPRREDIEWELAGARFFTRLDANSGFHQIPLHDETSTICTFATPFCRYRFLRLPFGVASAPEVFQKALSEIFETLPGVRVYVYDVIVWDATRQEHDERLREVLEAAQKAGLTFNTDKCSIGVRKIFLLGDVIAADGIRPNATLVSSLLSMPPPTDKQAVQRMLGVVNYLSKFLPSITDRTKLLRDLIKKDRIFEWTENHAKEWKMICDSLSKDPVLAIFYPKRITKITSDASQNGIGSALWQRYEDSRKPIAYASRVLTEDILR